MQPPAQTAPPIVTVTGASGFLGRAVTRALRNAGAQTLGVSRTGRPGYVDVRVADYDGTPRGEVLVHLAEQNNRGAANSDETHEAVTIARFENLLAKGFGHVVYASSMAVYCPAEGALREDAAVCAADGYTRAKLACERLALDAGGSVVRLANVFGPGMSPATVVWTILEQIPGEGPVHVWDTSPVRDFVAVQDAANGLAIMAIGRHAGLFNIGTGTGVSVGQLAATMLDLAGESHREVVSTKPSGTYSSAILDIGKAAEYLQWKPAVDLHTGLAGLLRHRHETDL